MESFGDFLGFILSGGVFGKMDGYNHKEHNGKPYSFSDMKRTTKDLEDVSRHLRNASDNLSSRIEDRSRRDK